MGLSLGKERGGRARLVLSCNGMPNREVLAGDRWRVPRHPLSTTSYPFSLLGAEGQSSVPPQRCIPSYDMQLLTQANSEQRTLENSMTRTRAPVCDVFKLLV